MVQINSGALSFIFEINSHKYSIGQMSVGKFAWQEEEVQKEDINIALIISGTNIYFRALQGRSGRNLIDLSFTRQCDNSAWIIPSHLPHWMCIQSSFNHQQCIDTWRSGFKQKTSKILLAH